MPRDSVNFKPRPIHPSDALPAGSLCIVQVTDSHLYANPQGCLAGINTQQSFDRILSLASSNVPQMEMILATGDLVHDASPDGYLRARERLQAMGVPVYCLPGNHDKPQLMNTTMNIGRVETCYSTRRHNWLILMLDTTIPRREGGHLTPEQLATLDQSLSEDPECHVLVCMHHHPVPINSAWMDSIALDNPDELFRVLDRHANVRGLLWGHIHQQFDGERNGVRMMGSPSTCIQFLQNQDAFGIDNQPPGLRWLELLPNGVIRSGVERLGEMPMGLDLRSAGY